MNTDKKIKTYFYKLCKTSKPKNALTNKFTLKELLLMKAIFLEKINQPDKYFNSIGLECCPLDYAIEICSEQSKKTTIDALIYLGYLDDQGNIADTEKSRRYFHVGPIKGTPKNDSWTNDTDIYVTRAGFNLVQQVVDVFFSESHLFFTNN